MIKKHIKVILEEMEAVRSKVSEKDLEVLVEAISTHNAYSNRDNLQLRLHSADKAVLQNQLVPFESSFRFQ